MASLLPPWPFYRAVSVSSSSPTSLNESDKVSLRHYATPGVAPPSARIDPKLKLQPRRPMRLWDFWKYGVVVATKATEITGDVLSHHIWGPRKKSWGIEMTILTSLMRGAGRHSSLVDIGTIRMLMSIGGLVPLPSDALVTPVTFRVKKRRLRGLLMEFDAAETGSRELSGEWVVGKKTWQRLQAEWKATHSPHGSSSSIETQSSKIFKKEERVILYIHGGAYYLSSAAAQRLISIPLSKYTDARVFALDYRLAPETRFPGPLHDVVSGYLRLLEDLHIPAENIIICGDSAGGGLSLALLMYLRDNDYPMPSGAILMSPWVDLTMSCESWDSNAVFDVVPFPSADNHMNPIALYLGESTEQYLTHPYASPLFGDFQGLPPLLIQAGDAEVLRDEITLLAQKATLAGVGVRHELYEDAIHVFQAYPFLPATRRSFISMRDFVKNILPQIQTRSPQLLGLSAEWELEQEIENENATVVRGDGIETKSGMESVKEKLGEEERIENATAEDDSSWGHSRPWSLSVPPTPIDHSDDDDDDGSDDELIATRYENSSHSSSPSSPTNTVRRIQSAVSLVLPSPPIIPKPSRHKSSDSQRSLLGLSNGSESKSTLNRHPTLQMSTVNSPPPSPSLRRSTNSNHPDITSLVENWTAAGPANQTLLYKSRSSL